MESTLHLSETELKQQTHRIYTGYNTRRTEEAEFNMFFMIARMEIYQCKWENALKWFGKANEKSITANINENFELLYWTAIAFYNLGDIKKVKVAINRILKFEKPISHYLKAETIILKERINSI